MLAAFNEMRKTWRAAIRAGRVQAATVARDGAVARGDTSVLVPVSRQERRARAAAGEDREQEGEGEQAKRGGAEHRRAVCHDEARSLAIPTPFAREKRRSLRLGRTIAAGVRTSGAARDLWLLPEAALASRSPCPSRRGGADPSRSDPCAAAPTRLRITPP